MVATESTLMILGDQAEGCDVYGCTREADGHGEPELGAAETWHYNEQDGVHFPVLTAEAEAEQAAEEEARATLDQRMRAARLEQEQVQHRITRLQQHRNSWFLSIQDTQFIHEMMGQATAFSGDFKPVG